MRAAFTSSTTAQSGLWPVDFQSLAGQAEFESGELDPGVRATGRADDTALALHSGAAAGTWTSRWHEPRSSFTQLIPSWQAQTPPGTWVTVGVQVRTDTTESRWFHAGTWAFDSATVRRQSVENDQDDVGSLATDVFSAKDDPPGGNPRAYRLRVTLNGPSEAKPTVRRLGASTVMPGSLPAEVSRSSLAGAAELDVPRLSQVIHTGEFPAFGGGGRVWCSPTSVTMVMQYWGAGPTDDDISALPADPLFDAHYRHDPAVPWAAVHTWDYIYGGAGNWPFNTAYASHYGLDGSVRHYPSLRDVESWIDQRVPVVISIRWDNESDNALLNLDGADIGHSDGHLVVVVGFTDDGDVIVNDPASPTNDQVRRTYRRDQFEHNWLRGSKGVTYIIKPA